MRQRIEHDEIEGLRAGRFKTGINTSSIVYRIRSVVIDTGPPNQWPVIRQFLYEKNVSRILLTHHHEDHSGNSARIRKEFDVPVMIHSSGKNSCVRGVPLKPYQYIIWGKPEVFEPLRLPEKIELEGGLHLRSIHCPGHSADMVCFYQPDNGWLFTGDLFVATKSFYLRKDEDANQQIQSLQMLLNLDFSTVLCSHRGVVANGYQAVQKKLDYMVSLRDKVRNLHQEGRSVKAITRILLGKEGFMSWVTGFHYSKQNLIKSLLPSETQAIII